MTAGTANLDLAARRRALDPGRSFIVQAPAGSGKTELLTQRLLRLLDCVDLPEQVLAITFTRKAAAEMRQRVVETLRAATSHSPAIPDHRQESLALARAVLQRSERLGWSLADQTQRLRILTIDALSSSLARQLPLSTGGIVSVRIADNAEHLYTVAARRTAENLADEGVLGVALRRLLEQADNSMTTLEGWLAAALPQRDRWIRELERSAGDDLPRHVAANVGRLQRAVIERVEALLGKDRAAALHALLARRAPAPGAESIAAPVAGGFDQWREVAALLLTTKGEWRQRFTKREGFGGDAGQLRETLESLMTGFRATAGLREALAEVTALPPAGLGAPQHEVLAALGPVLRRLLAELKLAFAGAGSVDHAELALAAQEALGAVDAPSELLLALDRRIEHILVDEFQDTSHLQWGLLERLTAGWQSGDGRSLFLVGDPMQSIYRFRDADLSLFLRAREEGIGALRLEPVRLAVNYRSAAELVDWVNATFPALFTPAGDVEGQGPGFTGATSGLGNKAGAGVSLETLPVDSHAEEIARVVEIVKAETSTRPQQSIGILVRNRTHLAGLRAALMRDQLAAHAVEIDSPVDTELGLDLLALTSALLHAGDRLAWLALLRGPCCGLDWRDLERLVDGGGERTIRELLDDPGRRASLSADGEKRAQWLLERLHVGDGLRAGRTLGAWIRECWMLIDGPACLSGPDEIGLAESFFLELDALGLRGDVDDPAVLSRAFSRPASGAVARQTGIEIMTIHKAKGLEFDTVIVPGLSRGGGRDSSKLLLLHDFTLQNGERICLMAGAAAGDDPLQSFLRRAARAEERRERARLLYVAATRAKRRLCLLARVSERNRRQRSDSLFALLAAPPGAVAGRAPSDELVEESPDMEQEPEALRELPLERLRFDDAVPWPPSARVEETPDRRARPEFEWAHPASAQVGTLIHRELQRLCERSAAAGELLRPQGPVTRHRRELALLGIEPEDVGAAAERVREALERIWSDPAGRKILHPWPEAWSELRISCHGGDRIEHLRIDRSFVDADGVRWIIDYKSGRHLGADVEAFLDSELARYRPQLERYAEVVAAIDPRPIRVGLYFPLLQRQRDWVPAVSAGR